MANLGLGGKMGFEAWEQLGSRMLMEKLMQIREKWEKKSWLLLIIAIDLQENGR